MKKVVVTGGSGYIGSHVCLALAEAGYQPIIFDNHTARRRPGVLDRLQRLTGEVFSREWINFESVSDIRESITRHEPDAVVHLAGDDLLRSHSTIESPRLLHKIYKQHYWAGLNLIQAMESVGCRQLVSASSSTVYQPLSVRDLNEFAALTNVHPIGLANKAQEQLQKEVEASDPRWRVGILRLFEVVGAHTSMQLGPSLTDSAYNWLMELAHVAAGLIPHARVRTHSGNCHRDADKSQVRDYIHVMDVGECVVAALRAIEIYGEGFIVNAGGGIGLSRLKMLAAFESACESDIIYHYTQSPAGDIPVSVANTALSEQLLGWRVKRGVEEMCKDTWNWHKNYLQRTTSGHMQY